MRVFKQKDQSFLAGVFGFQGKLFFSAAALLFFDLEHPEPPLSEQELWPLVKARLPQGTPLDAAMPKPQAEVLVHGRCHPPRGRELEGARVRLQLGELDKSLYVFGPRHWERTQSGWSIRRDPAPHGPLPLTWEHAFGGPDCPENPVGLGQAPLQDGQGGILHPLPRIEDPGQLIGAITDRPRPAGFAPLAQTWPQRMRLAGTCDAAWLREHWPALPPDLDLRFFNTAPEDQQLSGRYFEGKETLRLEGMHPRYGVLASRLPGLRIRCFATLLDDPRGDRKDLSKAHFQELKTNLDTVWLFPEDLRGVLCFRGVCEIKDEEYRDVANVLLVTEPLQAPERPLEYYRDLRDTWVQRALKLDAARMDAGQEAVAQALARLQDLPQGLREHLDQALGQVPHLPRSPAEQFAKGQAHLAAAEANLDRLEALAKDLRRQHGHLVAMDLSSFDRLRETIARQRTSLAQEAQEAAGVLQDVQSRLQDAHQQAVAQQAKLAARGLHPDCDPDDILLGPKEERWPRSALRHLALWQRHLQDNGPLLRWLHGLGLTPRTIERRCLGFNPAPVSLECKAWGLPPQEGQPLFTIPAGLVLPQFTLDRPVALRIRPCGTAEESLPLHPPLLDGGVPDHLVPGSQPPDAASWLLGGVEGRPMLLAAEPLEALLLWQEAGDLCAVLVCPEPKAPLDQEARALLDAAPARLVVVSAPDAAGAHQLQRAWRKALPDVVLLDLPPEGGCEAKRRGYDLRTMIRRALPPEVAAALPEDAAPLTPADVKPGLKLPLPDIKALHQELRDRVKAQAEAELGPLRAEAMAQKDQALAQAAEQLRKHGLDPAQYLKPPPERELGDLAAIRQDLAAGLAQARNTMQAKGQLTPELERDLLAAEARSGAMLDKAAAKVNLDGSVRLPEWAKELRAKHGLDPETGQGPDRAWVAAELAAGRRDFHGRNFSGLDLSGLDFSGADLSGSVCLATDFSGCTFTDANLAKAVCKEARFPKAVLLRANLERCVLLQADLAGADLKGTRCHSALLAQACCQGADFSDADLERGVFVKTDLEQARLTNVRGLRGLFKEAKLEGARFAGSDLTRAVFADCDLGGLDFSGLKLHRASFLACRGNKVSFAGADLEKARFLKGCDLPGACFGRARLVGASLLDCALPGADFGQALLDHALLQGCDLRRASFVAARARHARFAQSDLEAADLSRVNLLLGSLRKARLVQADLSHANLFGVDFFKAVMGHTRLDGSELGRSLLHKRTELLP